ncbi:helix-turn-helix domain-containing protein [Bdellovibrio bacteriovorus]|uniref:helix-turn-helix domain-containing protein n=1 Tax=Bdellovibrio bacteriovorus TaxID=959 RepID=UPI0035A73757
MAIKKTLGQILKEKRLAASLSQAEVSGHFGYSTPQFISNWERDVSAPPVDILKKIAALYGISGDEMLELMINQKVQEITKDMRRKFYGR